MRKHIGTTILSRPTIWFGAILACCLGHSLHPALAAPGSWTLKAPMPMALDAHASCEVDGILYVIGGHKDVGIYTQLPTLFAYDPKTDSWTRKKDMPTARRWPAACVVDGIIYVIGGGCMFSPPLQSEAADQAKPPLLRSAEELKLVGGSDNLKHGRRLSGTSAVAPRVRTSVWGIVEGRGSRPVRRGARWRVRHRVAATPAGALVPVQERRPAKCEPNVGRARSVRGSNPLEPKLPNSRSEHNASSGVGNPAEGRSSSAFRPKAEPWPPRRG